MSATEPATSEPVIDSKITADKPHAEEPQNALTEKFTDAEWNAIKDLRGHLPDIFKAAYPSADGPTRTSTVIWGVTIDTASPSAKESVVLVKFLRARELDVSKASEMLTATLKWREEFKIEELMKEEFPADVFGQLAHVYGTDKDGRPIVYYLYGANKDLKAVFGDVYRFIRWRVQLMEKSVALLNFETVDQMIQVHDYEGVGLSSRDANSKAAASKATTLFQDYYPELLYKKFFVSVPTLLTWVFWLFRPLVSANTLAKMHVVGSGPATIGKELLPFIDASQLPKRYGGSAEAF